MCVLVLSCLQREHSDCESCVTETWVTKLGELTRLFLVYANLFHFPAPFVHCQPLLSVISATRSEVVHLVLVKLFNVLSYC